MGRKGLAEFEHQVLLAVARLEDGAYSVPIVVELEERTGKEISPAAVHVCLRRMEAKGLVRSRLATSSPGEGGRTRRYVQLTPEGIEQLRETRRVLVRLWEGLEPSLDRP